MPSRKGSPNFDSREFRAELTKACKLQDFHLISAIVDMAKNGEEASVRLQAMKLCVDYAYPKLRAVEASVVEPIEVIITDEAGD